MHDEQSLKELDKNNHSLCDGDPCKKENSLSLSKLIFIVCFSIVGLVFFNIINCTFMIPGTFQKSYTLGNVKNAPSIECKDIEKKGYETLIALLTTVIALKTKLD